jgi:hypothetical protein
MREQVVSSSISTQLDLMLLPVLFEYGMVVIGGNPSQATYIFIVSAMQSHPFHLCECVVESFRLNSSRALIQILILGPHLHNRPEPHLLSHPTLAPNPPLSRPCQALKSHDRLEPKNLTCLTTHISHTSKLHHAPTCSRLSNPTSPLTSSANAIHSEYPQNKIPSHKIVILHPKTQSKVAHDSVSHRHVISSHLNFTIDNGSDNESL